MVDIVINSFFTKLGAPALGLVPTIRIWEVSDTGVHNLLIGATNGSTQNTDGTMSAVVDGSSDDGFYSFVFTGALGYTNTGTFLVQSDGGNTLPTAERYQVVSITADVDPAAVADAVWEADAINYPYNPSTPTMGGKTNSTHTNSESVLISIAAMTDAINTLLQYETGRTKIDPVNNTLTVYDNDCTTPLRVFKLLDSSGVESVTEVCERKPVSASDGLPVCP